jgi:hypothetical protein
LIEIANIVTDGWTLIGGQLVQLQCWERGGIPERVTFDVDTVLDIQSDPQILRKFTSALVTIGFKPQTSATDLQYKWIRADASIDILLPDHSGERVTSRTGVTGGSLLETPGGRRVLDFSEKVKVNLDGQAAIINRPTFLGTLFIKSKALSNTNDTGKDRHMFDIATLSTIFETKDFNKFEDKKVKSQIESAVTDTLARPDILAKIKGSAEGLQQIKLLLE